MLAIPTAILERYLLILKKRAVPVSRHADYKKWLRYFLDFRGKYTLPDSRSDQVRMFIRKLRDKQQTTEQQKQAAHAISLFFESQPKLKSLSVVGRKERTAKGGQPAEQNSLSAIDANSATVGDPAPDEKAVMTEGPPVQKEVKGKRWGARYNEWRCMEKSSSPDWDKLIDGLAAEIKTRHYSRKTLKTYADWVRKFQSYLQNKQPDTLSASDVKAVLSIFD